MRQYLDVKRQHRDAIVLFRMGDFYEMFYEDAVTASRVLELALTSRAKEAPAAAIPMCGVPYHALDAYLRGWCARAIASPSAIRSKIRARRKASSSAR